MQQEAKKLLIEAENSICVMQNNSENDELIKELWEKNNILDFAFFKKVQNNDEIKNINQKDKNFMDIEDQIHFIIFLWKTCQEGKKCFLNHSYVLI